VLKGVNQFHAVLMVILIAVSIPIAFLNELNAIAALILVHRADFLSLFDKPQRDTLAMLFLNLHGADLMSPEYFGAFGSFPSVCWSTVRVFFLAFWASYRIWRTVLRHWCYQDTGRLSRDG